MQVPPLGTVLILLRAMAAINGEVAVRVQLFPLVSVGVPNTAEQTGNQTTPLKTNNSLSLGI